MRFSVMSLVFGQGSSRSGPELFGKSTSVNRDGGYGREVVGALMIERMSGVGRLKTIKQLQSMA